MVLLGWVSMQAGVYTGHLCCCRPTDNHMCLAAMCSKQAVMDTWPLVSECTSCYARLRVDACLQEISVCEQLQCAPDNKAHLGLCVYSQDIDVFPDHFYQAVQIPFMIRTHWAVMGQLVNDIQLLHCDLQRTYSSHTLHSSSVGPLPCT